MRISPSDISRTDAGLEFRILTPSKSFYVKCGSATLILTLPVVLTQLLEKILQLLQWHLVGTLIIHQTIALFVEQPSPFSTGGIIAVTGKEMIALLLRN